MKIIKATAQLINPPSYKAILDTVETAGRICYKSESINTMASSENFIRNIIKRGHEAVIEHAAATIKFTCDRGVSHEIVRHRMASYCQESTRYCNYSKDKFGNEITVIEPCYLESDSVSYSLWKNCCEVCEKTYFNMLNCENTPQEARAVLPNSLKTEVVMTANMREWRHFFKLRCAPSAHPQMREVANIALDIMKREYPVFFEDL